ncbi:HCL044Wp [Eremothecium sinecaudum]|uniref:HCL044Wp n=1 Tax=Eremothecium sinecaudum TaxID=45286 RepID=A0A0X8HRG9_9SACH|nr:HCL044Wp [Eremothecium sinecaudum]AMD20107.1 HCL044Wp [Eremothecium sinecaudum]
MLFRLAARGSLRVVGRRFASYNSVCRPLCVTRSFSKTIPTLNSHNEIIRTKLQSELDLENSNHEKELPDGLSQFLKDSNFAIVPSNGVNIAELVRKGDNETIHVFFDVAQIANLPCDRNSVEEYIEGKEEEEMQNIEDNSYANINVVVVKQDQSAVSFECLMNIVEGSFYVDSVTPYASASDALKQSADAEIARELGYRGPPFSNLDEDLQQSLEEYLESRYIGDELATFITSYSEYKENEEYISWLEKMRKFFS